MPRAADIARHEAELAKSDLDIAQGEQRVTEQLLLIQLLRSLGQSTALAEQILRAMEEQLVQWKAHRALIIERIAILKSS